MEQHTQFRIFNQPEGYLPRHLGVNMEVMDYHDEVNLWDWLADSGFTYARLFHPDCDLREPIGPNKHWERIHNQTDYDAYRQKVKRDPQNLIDWSSYRFKQRIAWLGKADGFIPKAVESGVTPLISIGYHPRMYAKPILIDNSICHAPLPEEICWEAAASAYEYYFAHIYWALSEHGVKDYMTLNEPENRPDGWHYPKDLADFMEQSGNETWSKLYRDDKAPTAMGVKYLEIASSQYAAVAQMGRDAINDVMSLTGDDKLKLIGVSGVVYEQFWQKSHRFLDSLDFHHYNFEPSNFSTAFINPSELAKQKGKTVSCSEYNRYSGGMKIEQFLFNSEAALGSAELVMEGLKLGKIDGPEVEFLMFYLFHSPSTHRNYKHLIYGDMNFIDWSGVDLKPWGRSDAWYPTRDEMMLRHPTPSYSMVKMLNRCVDSSLGRDARTKRLRVGRSNPTSAGPDDIHFHVKTLACSLQDRCIITFLNPAGQTAKGCHIDLSLLEKHFSYGVIRETSRHLRDQVTQVIPVNGEHLSMRLPPHSLTQLILIDLPLGSIDQVNIIEKTTTPGSISEGLKIHQTTRLRAIATLNGQELDVSETHVIWESSHPDLVTINSTGLVQRVRDSPEEVTLRVKATTGQKLGALTRHSREEYHHTQGLTPRHKLAGLAEQ